MPVFALDDSLIFPHPLLREEDGLLAVGGDLSIPKLLLAYRWGIFPWYHDDQPILWWWLTPRLMLHPGDVHISHSLHTALNQSNYTITIDAAFTAVMQQCGLVNRKGQDGTWITEEILNAYQLLHEAGHAHSVEVWEGDDLIGGLYGVVSGKIFCGESMFAKKSNTSKIAFVHLARHLQAKGFEWIDCQQDTPHMRSLGATLIEKDAYLKVLRENQISILQNQLPVF